jgi:TonB family protein
MMFLFEWTVKVALILGAAWIATLFGRKLSAATRHGIWVAALAGIVTAPALTFVIPASQPHVVLRGPLVVTATSSGTIARVNTAGRFPWVESPWLRVIWGAGCALSLLRLVAGFIWMRRRSRPLLDERCRNMIRKISPGLDVTLLTTGSNAMPITWGVFAPRIALPAGAETWGEDRLYVVLCHELAHVRRADWAWQIATEIVKAIYWFHPMVWLAARRLRQEGEIACDDIVLNSGVPATLYANELLSLTTVLKGSGWVEAPALAMAKTSDLERRFTSMLNPSLNRRPVTGKARLLTFCTATVLLVSLAALRAPAQNPAGVISGTVYDPDRAIVVNAKVTATNIDTHVSESTTTHSDGTYSFNNLLPGKYQITAAQMGFRRFDSPPVDLTGNQGGVVDANLTVGQMTELITVTAQGVSSGANATPQAQQHLLVGGNVQVANLIRQVKPPYPESARAAGIEGSVILSAVVDAEGKPTRIRVTRSMGSEFDSTALQAVSQWRYQPTLLNGRPVEVMTDITVAFKLKP